MISPVGRHMKEERDCRKKEGMNRFWKIDGSQFDTYPATLSLYNRRESNTVRDNWDTAKLWTLGTKIFY
jgi:hypothetical protein